MTPGGIGASARIRRTADRDGIRESGTVRIVTGQVERGSVNIPQTRLRRPRRRCRGRIEDRHGIGAVGQRRAVLAQGKYDFPLVVGNRGVGVRTETRTSPPTWPLRSIRN